MFIPESWNTPKFDLARTPWREHRLCAYWESDDKLRAASSKKLIYLFEDRFLRSLELPGHVERLKGFDGDYVWHDGTMKFRLYSPEMPFFGHMASLICMGTPIVYSSNCTQSGPTPPRCFQSGKEVNLKGLSREDADLAKMFRKMIRSGKGVPYVGVPLPFE